MATSNLTSAVNRKTGLLIGLLLPCLGLLWLLSSGTGSANTLFVVNSTADSVDAIPGDGTCAAADNTCTLRAAVMESNALSGTERIEIPAGRYELSRAGILEDLGEFGDLDILSDLTIVGTGSQPSDVVIDGLNMDRVFHVPQQGTAVKIRNLTIENGNSQFGSGGGIESVAGLTLEDCRIVNNTAANSPGGVHILNGVARIKNCVISDNLGANLVYLGSGLTIQKSDLSNSSYGLYATSGRIIVEGSTFSGNTIGLRAEDRIGITGSSFFSNTVGLETTADSGIYSSTFQNNASDGYINYGYAEIYNSTFSMNGRGIQNQNYLRLFDSLVSDNEGGQDGAGIYNGFQKRLDIVRSDIISNTVTFPDGIGTGNGGGVRNFFGLLTIESSTISGNTAFNKGGGLSNETSYNQVNNPNRITNSDISNNIATNGGGGGIHHGAGTLLIDSSLIANNTSISAGGFGGGINIDGASEFGTDLITIVNSTISGNRSTRGGALLSNAGEPNIEIFIYSSTITDNSATDNTDGLYNEVSDITIANSILSGNAGGDCTSSRPLTSGGYNLIGAATGCPISGDDELDLSTLDTVLGPLDTSYSPPSHPPLSGTAIVDAANPIGCLDPFGMTLEQDQRGYFRVVDGDSDGAARCDIGAHELGEWPPVTDANNQYLPALWEGELDSDIIPTSPMARLIDEPTQERVLLVAGYLGLVMLLGAGAFALPFAASKREDELAEEVWESEN